MQTLTPLFSALAAILVFLPLLFLLVRTMPGTSLRLKWVSVAIFSASFLFLALCRHQTLYSGLDNQIYPIIEKAFRHGVQAVHRDTFFASIPQEVSDAFLCPRKNSSQSHDMAFKFARDGFSRPWYMVMYPLVASRFPDGLFVPLLGAVWTMLLFLGCCRGRGAAGISVFLLCFFATAYPLWLFRDECAEVAGAALIASVILSHSTRPLNRPLEFAIAAFLVGLSTAFHKSILLLALPMAFLLFVEGKTRRNRLAVAIAFVAGLLVLVLETRYVGDPHDNWTQVLPTTPQASSRGAKLMRGYLLRYVLPKSGTNFAYFTRALQPTLDSLGITALLLFFSGCIAVFRDKRSNWARKILPFVLLWPLFSSIGRLGRDATVGRIAGVWDFRRIFPCVLVYLSLFATPLSDLVACLLEREWPWPKITFRKRTALVVVAAAFLGIACIMRNPVAYFAVDGKGSREIADEIRAELGKLEPDLVVFDFFRHHLPFAYDGNFKVLGISKRSPEKWEAVEKWLADVAQTQRVVLVSSWTPPSGEKDLLFDHVRTIDRDYESVKSKRFMDAVIDKNNIRNTILLARPRNQEADSPRNQEFPFTLTFDGSPLGLRGSWGPMKRHSTWSLPMSGFIAPFPRTGHPLDVIAVTTWEPPAGAPTNREVCIEGPGFQTTFTVGDGQTTNTFVLASDIPSDSWEIGEYQISTSFLFDPTQYGIRGYPKDLGVKFHSITLKPQSQAH